MNTGHARAGWTLLEIILLTTLVGAIALATVAHYDRTREKAVAKKEAYLIGVVQEGINIHHAHEMLHR